MANAHCIDNKSLFNFSNAIWVRDNDDENSLQLWMIKKMALEIWMHASIHFRRDCTYHTHKSFICFLTNFGIEQTFIHSSIDGCHGECEKTKVSSSRIRSKQIRSIVGCAPIFGSKYFTRLHQNDKDEKKSTNKWTQTKYQLIMKLSIVRLIRLVLFTTGAILKYVRKWNVYIQYYELYGRMCAPLYEPILM